jgi:hypothetical protein
MGNTNGRENMVPHKSPPMPKPAFNAGNQFKVIFQIMPVTLNAQKTFGLEELKSLFELFVILGDIGKRSRRAMGACKILSSEENGKVTTVNAPIDLNHIHGLLKKHTPNYSITNNKLVMIYGGSMQYYPWIKQIQIGKPKDKPIQVVTSYATNALHGKYKQQYEPNLGHAFKGRFASPIYVSAIDKTTAIITTLNTIPDRNSGDVDTFIQEEFKNKIL